MFINYNDSLLDSRVAPKVYYFSLHAPVAEPGSLEIWAFQLQNCSLSFAVRVCFSFCS